MHGYDNESEFVDIIQLEFCSRKETGLIFPPHWHEELVLMYVMTGVLLLKCEGENYVINEKCIAVINPNEIHSAEAPEQNPEYYVMKINILQLMGTQVTLAQTDYAKQLLRKEISFENIIEADEILLSYIKNIIHEYKTRKEGYQLAIRGAVYQILAILMREYFKTTKGQSAIGFQYRRLEQIKPAISFMENHLAEKINLSKLSEETHLSAIQFSRIFKIITGATPMDYLNQLRVQKAADLLLTTNETIIEIAMKTGFTDSNYFSRIFKKYRNITPSDFRIKYVRENS
jgi:AraC-like DNA-binding protein